MPVSPRTTHLLIKGLLLVSSLCCFVQILRGQSEHLITPFERDQDYSASYEEAHAWYAHLSSIYPELQATVAGYSDAHLPLYEVVIARPAWQSPTSARAEGKTVLFILNAIHPGEPCGVDASMLLTRQLLLDRDWNALLDDLVVVILPYYNVDGGRERGPWFRANQIGPQEQGFRGNGRNLDLNRDFMKADSRNTRVFQQLFHKWDPDLFIDTHTTNGADYQHTLTLIPTMPDKLASPLAIFQQEVLLPYLYKGMAEHGWPMCPYVHGDQPPEQGLYGFLDLPRYSTGYTALFHCLGFMTEAHMLKSFADRVMATKAFLEQTLLFLATHGRDVQVSRQAARAATRDVTNWPVLWERDTTRQLRFSFMGFEATTRPGAFTGTPHIWYDRTRPWTDEVSFFPHYRPIHTVEVPEAWIIPRAWPEVIERLLPHPVLSFRVPADTLLGVRATYILSDKAAARAYEGRFLRSDVQTIVRHDTLWLREGDLIVPARQDALPYLVHALEPTAPDSWYAWNFFDAILQQKEYFSTWLFEEEAARWMADRPELRRQWEEALREDPSLREHPRRQLDWVYRHSSWYEPTHRRYPVLGLDVVPDTWPRP
jgi:hypothetical protein